MVLTENPGGYKNFVKAEWDSTRSRVAKERGYKMDARAVMFKLGKGEFSSYNLPFVKGKTEVLVL